MTPPRKLDRWDRPSVAECEAACAALVRLHGSPEDNRASGEGCDVGTSSVLDSLVRTILSQNTTDVTSHRAFAELKRRLPTWEAVLEAPNSEVEDAIREGGLAAIKVERIKAILLSLMAEVGSCSLEHLRSCSEAEVKEQLTRFKGVGPKTVACVQLFCLGRQEFPVDTHVLHICKRLGWLPSAMPREAAYEHLNSVVPGNLKFQLHVLMVQHGKVCSACMKVVRKTKGQSGPCPLTPLCSKAKAAPSPSGSKMLQSKPGKSSANLALCPGDAGRSSFVKMEADALQQPAVKHEVKEEQIGAVAAEAVKRRRKA